MKKLLFLVLLLSNFFGFAQYTLIPDVNFEQALIYKGFDSGAIDGKVLTAKINGITRLDVFSINISDLTGIQDFISLTFLECSGNRLTSLDLSKNIALLSLNCHGNLLTSLDVSKNSNLTNLDCIDNKLTDLDVSKNLVLLHLECWGNQLKSLDISKNTFLTYLDCWENNLTSLDISKNTVLTYLECSGNQLTSLDISKNTVLTYFGCSLNQLTSLDVTKNTALKGLSCHSNLLTSLDVSKNIFLNRLSCDSNQLTNLDVSKNTSLINFTCSKNQLNSLNLKNGNNKNINPIAGFDLKSNPKLTCIQVDNINNANTYWSSYKDATASFSDNCSKIAATVAPIITATGNQTYCPGTSLNIVETVSISSDPTDPVTDAVYIQISSGYVLGQDKLNLTGSHPTITTNWSESEGKLTLTSATGLKIPYSDFESAIKDVTFNNSSATASGTRNFSISLGTGQLSYLPSNKHFYEYVPNLGVTWTAAKALAQTRTYYGLQGYLATLTSADEAQLAGAQALGAGWIGGSDATIEGTWKWVTGPEGLANSGTGVTFWMGNENGSVTPPFNYANWNSPNEPNNNGGNENYAHITFGVGKLGSWNDLPNPGTSGAYYPQGYVVEYGGMIPNDVDLIKISASTKITIATLTSSNPNPICGSGSFALQATTSIGTIKWYDSAIGGNLVETGNNFNTPPLSTTTTYYIDNGCAPRIPIVATINPIPTITSINSASRCDAGTVTLGATASAGTINWYSDLTGGTSLGTGTTFTTSSIAVTTNYYVEATANGCTSPTRTLAIATVNTTPTITSTTPESRCDPGSVTLGAVASAGTINWYDAPNGGISLKTGTSFTTPNLTATTTYYVDASTPTCTSPRTPIIATINVIPTITSTTSVSQCDSGTVTLNAIASEGTINWYDVSTGGNLVGTGTSFTTPSLLNTTTYYADATANGCTSPSRSAVTAIVNTTPSIITTTPAIRCDSGSVTLLATASAGTINWYDVASGGAPIGTGNSFSTPNLTSTTTYYVDTTDNQCTSPRLSVIATVIPITIITEEVILCQSESTTLDASIPGMKYLWSPNGETTQSIVVSSIGDYNVTISSPMILCDSKKLFNVIEHPAPTINSIIVKENSITIELSNPETYYEYSINGIDFQSSNQFSYIPSGDYVAYVRETNQCNLVQQNFTIFTVSKYFTPNNDGFNDIWEIKELLKYPNSYAIIYDRYGKIIQTLNALKISWDGTYNNVRLPSDDYWYRLILNNSMPEMKGHFTLKR